MQTSDLMYYFRLFMYVLASLLLLNLSLLEKSVVNLDRPGPMPGLKLMSNMEPTLCLGLYCHKYLLSKEEVGKANVVADRYALGYASAIDVTRAATTAHKLTGLDYTLILAVGAVESRFDPEAVSNAGAKGIMQIIPRYHKAVLESWGTVAGSLWDPVRNILSGAYILKSYSNSTAGKLCQALKKYNGASDFRYANKVLSEKKELDILFHRQDSTQMC